MKRLLGAAALAVLTLLPGGAAAQGGPPAAPALVRGADPAIWQGSEASGPIVHVASKVTLPAELQGFVRTGVSAVGPEDAIARYKAKDGPTETVASVYLFRPGGLPEHKLKGSVASFASLSPEAFLWSSGPFDIGAAPRLHAAKMVFKTGVGPNTVMDYLYFVALGRWTVKVRATMSGVREDEAEGKLDAFVRDLPWGQILDANGDCTGPACTAPAFDGFRSHYGEMMLPRLLAAMMKFEPKKEAKLPVADRARASLLGEVDVRRSAEPPLLYVATVPRLATYRVVKLPDPVTRLFTEGFGRLSIDKPVYGLLIDTGAGMLLARLYNGEPTAEAFGEDIDDLVLIGAGNPFLPVKDFAETIAE
jgi:hypothetical protein